MKIVHFSWTILNTSSVLKENYEFERQLLGFGDGIKVVQPESLRKKIKSIIIKSLENYKEV